MSIIGAVLGVGEVTAAVIGAGVKLAAGARQVDDGAARRMVDLMKGRVPQNDGRLYNGITAELSGEVWTVKASAPEPPERIGAALEDYASFVEFGTEDTEPQPFFWPSVDEVLPERELALRRIAEGVEL